MAKRKSKKTPSKILVLRTCDANMRGHGGFTWPRSGPVEAPDWDPDPEIDCGRGLHGLAWGEGDWSLLSKDDDAVWLVVEVDAADLVVGSNKARFCSGVVLYAGVEAEAVCRVMCGPENTARIESLAGKKHHASGYSGRASASGASGRASASGDFGRASTSGTSGRASASGNYGRASASGYYGRASASGDSGIAATLANGGTVRAGANGLLICTWWDDAASRHRACVGEVGIDGIEADTDYCVREGKLVRK